MKKTTLSLLTGILLLVASCLFPLTASAAGTLTVSIPIEIEGGGTAIVIPEVNCPMPEQTSIEVANGTTEHIKIVISEPGSYIYTIRVEKKAGVFYSPESYTAYVDVVPEGAGQLSATIVLTKSDSTYKPDVCLFVLSDDPGQETPGGPDDPSQPDTPTQPSKDPPTSRPKTGDDHMLDVYLLICIASAGGLFLLAVVYYASTDRLIGKK